MSKVNTTLRRDIYYYIPSTQSQVDFAKNVLIPEMKRLALENVLLLATAIGTLAITARTPASWLYFPTADFNAENIQPQVIEIMMAVCC